MSAPDPEDVESRIIEAVERVLGDVGEFTMKFVAIIETTDKDGVRGIWTATSTGCTSWDSMGLLRYALSMEDAGVARREVE